jgi:hypothetical protein
VARPRSRGAIGRPRLSPCAAAFAVAQGSQGVQLACIGEGGSARSSAPRAGREAAGRGSSPGLISFLIDPELQLAGGGEVK